MNANKFALCVVLILLGFSRPVRAEELRVAVAAVGAARDARAVVEQRAHLWRGGEQRSNGEGRSEQGVDRGATE